MTKKSNFLIIWDFDGVIADTEKLWLQTRMELLNKVYGLNWDMNTVNNFLGGMSDKTKQEVLLKLGIKTDEEFWKEALRLDMEKMLKGFALTDGIRDIFDLSYIEQCIATGGIASKTEQKIKMVGIENYFPPQKVFTADMVAYSKPEPDLFLLAAESMGFEPQNCIVVEDSVAGLTAAQRAKMIPIAFIGSDLYDKANYTSRIKNMGINNIFDNMSDVKIFIENIINN